MKEVPHLKKISSEVVALRMTIVDEGEEVDISAKCFSSQIRSFINKGMKIILVRVTVEESPVLVCTSTLGGKVRIVRKKSLKVGA